MTTETVETTTVTVPTAQLEQLAARLAITNHSEQFDRDRLMDDYHDLMSSLMWTLEAAGVPLPDPKAPETARMAWL